MSVKKTLFMLTLNYILIFAWMFLYRMGVFSALVIFPASMLIAFFDTVLSTGKNSAILWCGNLLIANIAGILLQAYIYVRETNDMDTAILRCAVEIPVAILIIGITAAISGHAAWKREKKRRIAGALAKAGKVPSGEGNGPAYGYGMPRDSIDHWEEEDTDEDYPAPDEEEDDTEDEGEAGFRVIKKS